ncbi:MAG TPA: class II aldolase/adducin family protein [Methanothermobacter sp.]|nr:class II aldolase/adducin family protein [Methanothermobacter sp.]HOL68891.1 class II aldolase/adducin family protein [Methanothermobacter sp.]HPQ04970.1 class II aldolase/adducin family protein [Methanothermobacter sp.]HPU37108.1 class II aldolase/adducin family protein [Methanothermobacter sp.]
MTLLVNIKKLVEAAHYLYKGGFVSGFAGNISMRLTREKIAITPTRIPLSLVTEENVAIVDMDGRRLLGGNPSSEVYLHIGIYKKRKDINGIVHTHSPYATAFAFSDKRLKGLEGFNGIKGDSIEKVAYHRPGSMELARECAKKIKDGKILILENHGVVSCGSNLQEAVQLAEFIEESAKIQFLAYILKNLN